MAGDPRPVVGREQELAVVERFVRACVDGPASLVIEGAAGIGKTVIWRDSLATAGAAGVAVRSSRCGESDAGWGFAGLGDLLDGVEIDVLQGLPVVQQQALSVAMLTGDAGVAVSGERVVAVGVLGVLRRLAATGPLLLAVDDVQWLDPSTRRVLSFALRRLRGEPVRLLTSLRLDPLSAGMTTAADLGLPGDRLPVGPVSVGAVARILRSRLEITVSRPTLTRLHEMTGGNPMVCLEMARALQRRGTEPAADEPLPVPADLRLLVTDRLCNLRPESRRFLLLTAAMAQPTVDGVSAAMGDHQRAARSLEEVVAAGVIDREGSRLRFTHPLLASIPYGDLLPDDRRRLHADLAASATDPEEHARHAALASPGRRTAVAEALMVAARHARRRGSRETAAELALLAVDRTPLEDADALLERRVEAADHQFRLGDTAVARSLLEQALDAASPGPRRVPGLLLLATVMSWEEGDEHVAETCDRALDEAADDPLLLARCHATYAETGPSGPAVDLSHARAAVRLLEAMEAPPADLLANALTNVALHGLRLGDGLAVALLERAVDLEALADPPGIFERAGMGLGMGLKHVDRFDESRVWLDRMLTCAVDEGDDSALPMVLGQLALLECWAGRYEIALAHADRGREVAARVGIKLPALASAHVLVLAHLGRTAEARGLGEQDLTSDESAGYLSAVPLHLRSLGFVELSEDHAPLAAAMFHRALSVARQIGTTEPAMMRLHPDAVAANLSIGSITEAEHLTAELDASSRANGLPWATTMAGRCHGLLYAAKGDLQSAGAALEQALSDHHRLPMPFEEARTRLVFGKVLLRSGHRKDAARELTLAQKTFLRLGTPIQADSARRLLASIGGRRSSALELTAVEGRVAALAADGRTNREVADELFISVRTVESHLGRIYRKLGLRSRTELARRLPEETTSEPT